MTWQPVRRPLSKMKTGLRLADGPHAATATLRQLAINMSKTEIMDPKQGGIARAAKLLHNGELVAIPTETVYGLGADACNDQAVARIFQAKERPQFNPLIVHVADVESARRIAKIQRRCRAVGGGVLAWPAYLGAAAPT